MHVHMYLPPFHIHTAVWTGHTQTVRAALRLAAAATAASAGATAAGSPNGVAPVAARDWEGRTLLHLATMLGYVDVAILLIREGSDLHATDSNGDSPLHLAAKHAQWRTVQLLAVQTWTSLTFWTATAPLCVQQ